MEIKLYKTQNQAGQKRKKKNRKGGVRGQHKNPFSAGGMFGGGGRRGGKGSKKGVKRRRR